MMQFITSMLQFQCVPTAYVTENKENYLENFTYQASCPLSLRVLNMKIPVTLQKIGYICMIAISSNLSYELPLC